ncbi:unnamed protein product (macronuclear) [Paramecium tetraurelia]|uniref:Chromosome undetermined scaffold_51, whole genome shotgun sequence n=1 Tax=Paramecium tetraurelia TaxID=5888 RepID=Q3SDI4_PARTE|nr:uncharacterized protein GSPATT00017163001 [Paramecium tetraurelia]CAI39374.1 rab_A08 [Paramecium tetraurelia]CAK82791.1 unnamed protein product [Paramecium tetraurelia]|eukprot:XP_001450188.1 hypothetical protein (macronuclear) [Paramecium tetraurelia strain d4-2]
MKQSFQIKSEIQLCFKIVFLGQSSVGKTSLIKQFLKNEFVMKSMSTVGVTCESKIVIVNNQQVKVQLWDTAGQERFRSITKNYYRGCDAVVIVYDVTNMKSFDQVSSWIADFDDKCERPAIKMLLGNKIDMQTRDVSTELGVAYSKRKKILFQEVSAKENVNVECAMLKLIEILVSHTKIESGDKNQRRGSMIETKQIVLEDPFINKSARFYKDVSISDHSKFQVIKSAGDSSQEDIQINNTSNRQLTSPQDNATHTHQQAETPLKLIHPRQSGIIRDEYFRKHSSNQSCMCSC